MWWYRLLVAGMLLALNLYSRVAYPRAPQARSAVRTTVAMSATESRWAPSSRLSIGPGVAIMEGVKGQMGFGGAVAFMFRASPELPLYFGMELGVSHWSVAVEKDQGGTKVKSFVPLTALHILPSAYYRFLEGPNKRMHAYLGFSVGPALLTGAEDAQVNGQALTGGGTEVMFEFLVRPGFEIDLSPVWGLSLEPRLGLLHGQFFLAPQMNLTISFD